MTKLKIGFIGLGNMGTPIAKNLIAAGFDVSVYNRSIEKMVAFKSTQATISNSPEEAAKDTDVLITMVSDDIALNEITQAVLPTMKAGSIHLSMSTVSPALVETLTPIHNQYSITYVASPVLGRPPAAEARLLFILLSGKEEAKNKVKPILDAISQKTFDYGEDSSTAHIVKVALNLLVFTNVELLAELMLLAEKKNIDKSVLLDTITNSTLGSPVLKIYGQLIIKEQNNKDGFAMRLASKDLRLAQETAQSSGLQLPLANLIRGHFEEIIEQGSGDTDVSLLIAHLRNKFK